MSGQTDCPTPRKHRYPSKRAARNALKYLYRRGDSGPGRLHTYRCKDHWHVGHTTY